MYILTLKGLKQQLEATGLAERDRYHYLMGWMVLGAVLGTAAIMRQQGFWPGLDIVVAGILSVISVWYAYSRNGGPDGSAFLDRFMSLGFVISIRQVFLGIAMLILHQEISYLLSFLGYSAALDEGAFDWIGSILSLVPNLYFIWAIGRHMRDVSRAAVALPARPGILTGVRGVPAGEQSSRRLERFVEAVVQRETAEAPGIRVIGRKAPRTKPRIIGRRSSRTGR
jgi:hypothetical protein